MTRRNREALDALLRPMLELEARLNRDYGDAEDDYALGDGQVRLMREASGLRLASDECEVFLATESPIEGRPGDPFARDA